jgi:class 3 adenylate cyclase/FixJ family two-component response regulator
MAKILVVDDETDLEVLIKQKFRQKIRVQDYEFFFAVNGVEALKRIHENPEIDIVLSDINMPEMDGLTLLTKLSEAKPMIKSVIVSAYGDMENIRTAMNRGAFDFITKPINFEDLSITIEKTLQQVNALRAVQKTNKENDILKMYVDKTVLNFMGDKEIESALVANESIEGSVVFIDICSFTCISELEPADSVVSMLNRFFDVMAKEIIAQNGYIDKFIGDAIMAVFRGEFHLDRAVEASLAVRKKITEMPAAPECAAFIPNVSIGINSGEMISGNIGSSSLRRLDYTVIGDTVNTAQRLQAVAAPGQVVINEASFLKIKESFHCNKLGEVTLKNKSGFSNIYEVIG